MQRAASTWLVVVILAGRAAGAEGSLSPFHQNRTAPLTDAVGETQRPAAGPVTLAPVSVEPLPGTLVCPSAAAGSQTAGAAGPSGGCVAGRPLVNAWHCFKAHMQWSHWGYPEEFVGSPLGASLRCHQQLQIANGLAARSVLYRYDFGDESTADANRLNGRGAKRLTELVAEWQNWPPPSVVVERTPGNPRLDSARVEYVAQQLRQAQVSVPVVAGDPPVPGLRGEAKTLAAGLLGQIRHNMTAGSNSPSGTTAPLAPPKEE